MLEVPPAAAMRYVKEWRGLEPSEYAGGGSPSSSLRDDCPLVSRGSARFVSATGSCNAATLELESDEVKATAAYAGAAVKDDEDPLSRV